MNIGCIHRLFVLQIATCIAILTLFTTPTFAESDRDLTVTLTAPAFVNDDFAVTITFSEAVEDFVTGDIDLSSGVTLTDFAPDSGNAAIYTAMIIIEDPGVDMNREITIDVDAGVAVAVDGKNGNMRTSLTVRYETDRPEVVSIQPADGNFFVSGPFDITITFSEPVTDLLASDIMVTGGTAVSLIPSSGFAETYTATIMPTNPTMASTFTITIPAGAAVDAAGNNNLNTATRRQL